MIKAKSTPKPRPKSSYAVQFPNDERKIYTVVRLFVLLTKASPYGVAMLLTTTRLLRPQKLQSSILLMWASDQNKTLSS